ncbi:MAG: hypothetical protein ACREX9_18400 [Gammaproteobacteria bacterium]
MLDQYAYYVYWNGRNATVEDVILHGLQRYRRIFFLPPNARFLTRDGVRPGITSPHRAARRGSSLHYRRQGLCVAVARVPVR